jgi:adenylate kinase
LFLQLQQDEDAKNAEVDILIPKVIPMRNYLMRAVMPTLIEGLIDCVKHRPENGIDNLVS